MVIYDNEFETIKKIIFKPRIKLNHNIHKVVLTQEIKIHVRIDLCYGHIKKKAIIRYANLRVMITKTFL